MSQSEESTAELFAAMKDLGMADGATATFDELKQRCDDIWRTHIEPEDPSTNLEVCTTAKQKKKAADVQPEQGGRKKVQFADAPEIQDIPGRLGHGVEE